MLGLAIDRVVKIDVQLQVDTEDLQEEYEEIMNHIMRKRQQQLQQEDLGDDMDESDDSDEDSEDNLELDPNQKRTLELKESVSKLDELMDLLFRFYNPIFAKGSSWDVNEVFDHMMTQFTHTILPVFQSRYTQFLVFHCAQSNPQLIDQFVSTCIRILTEKTRPDYIRLAASSYLASFVSRANRCSAATVRYVVDFLCQSLESDRELHETKDSVPDPHRFPAYYFTAQAIIYIFCFRWRVFMDLEEEDGDEFIENVVMGYEVPRFVPHIRQIIQRNIGCRLNPLKVCAPEIVDQFDRISSALKFTMATPIIASNKRLRISRPTVEAIAGYSARESAMSGGLNGMLQLEAFFPFDPYHLPQSVDWLKEDYNAWSPPPGMKHDFEDADEEDQRDTSEERNYRDNSLGLAEEEYEEDAGSESDVSA